jgi:hypothetical protein
MARFITEPKKRLPVMGNYDVVVAGGGPAGVASAVTAARLGAEVLLVEATGCLGGLTTAGLVPCFAPFSRTKTPLIEGFAWEVLQRLRRLDGVGYRRNTIQWVTINAEKLKLLYDRMAGEAGVRVLLFTLVADVIREKDGIRAIVIENKDGRRAVAGKVFIDATGDADLAARAGVPFEKGDEKGRMQGTTLCFTVAGIDTRKYFRFLRKHPGNQKFTAWLEKNLRRGRLKRMRDCEYRMIAPLPLCPGVINYNFGHVFGIDGTKTSDLSVGIAKGRELACNFLEFGRKNIPGMENAQLVATGAILGVRETRRIDGNCRLTADDYRFARHFPDDIALCDYPVDVHQSTGSKRAFERMMKTFFEVLPRGKSYGIPYRSIVPKRVRNLLVPGRALSSDRTMQGTARIIPVCMATGQAAGTAAVLSIKRHVPVGKVNIRELRTALTRQGVRLK